MRMRTPRIAARLGRESTGMVRGVEMPSTELPGMALSQARSAFELPDCRRWGHLETGGTGHTVDTPTLRRTHEV